MPRTDLRVLASSVRADPERLVRLNTLVADRIERARVLRIESGGGAELVVRAQAVYPIVSDAGRPSPGRWDNLPSGFVYFHPGAVNGVLTVDRLVLGPDAEFDVRTLRRSPLEVTFKRGAVESIRCESSDVETAVHRYLDHHPDASRVGFVSFPTNYLALAEIGQPHHDALLPGIRLQLGFSDARATMAPFDLDRGLRLVPRRPTVTIGDEVFAHNGRFAGTFAAAASAWAAL